MTSIEQPQKITLTVDDALVEAVAQSIHDWNPLMCKSWDQVKDSASGETRRMQAGSVVATLIALGSGGDSR